MLSKHDIQVKIGAKESHKSNYNKFETISPLCFRLNFGFANTINTYLS